MTGISLGENSKLTALPSERNQIRQFYRDVFGCPMTRESEAADVFRLGDSFFLGVVYDEAALSVSDRLKSLWLELRTDDPEKMKQKILGFGIRGIDSRHPEHFYFQAPGGQVFRLVGTNEDMSKWQGTGKPEGRVSEAKAEFTRAKGRIVRTLAATADDRMNWSPSPTARTPIQHVGHVAASTALLREMLAGEPFPFASLAEADAAFRDSEGRYTAREQVLALLDQTSAEYLAWLDTLTPAQLGSPVRLPFGERVLSAAIGLPADHLHCHTAQMEYMQTIYGDRTWHS